MLAERKFRRCSFSFYRLFESELTQVLVNGAYTQRESGKGRAIKGKGCEQAKRNRLHWALKREETKQEGWKRRDGEEEGGTGRSARSHERRRGVGRRE